MNNYSNDSVHLDIKGILFAEQDDRLSGEALCGLFWAFGLDSSRGHAGGTWRRTLNRNEVLRCRASN